MSASKTDSSAQDAPEHHTVDPGVRWKPVKPEELLLKTGKPSLDAPTETNPRIQRERWQELEHYIKNRPADIDAYLELAAIYRDLGRPVDSTRVLKTALEVEPDHPEVLWQVEEAVLARSLQQLREVRTVSKKTSNPEVDRALERAQVDWASRRVEVCRARLKRDPSLNHLRIIQAEALRDLGQYQEAIEAVGPALQEDNEATQAYLILAACRAATGDDLGTLVAIRKAVMRRAVPAQAKVRVQAMKQAIEIATRLGLAASLVIYQQALKQAEQELEAESPEAN